MPAESRAQTQNTNTIETVLLENVFVMSHEQVLNQHQPACEAGKEPIDYCCAL